MLARIGVDFAILERVSGYLIEGVGGSLPAELSATDYNPQSTGDPLSVELISPRLAWKKVGKSRTD